MVNRISEKITSEILDALNGDEEIKVKDTEITGFYAWYYPKTNLRTFFMRHFACDIQKEKIIKLGCYPVMPVNEAREIAASYKSTSPRGSSKTKEQGCVEEDKTLNAETLLRRYLTEYSAKNKKLTTYRIENGLANRFLYNEIGNIHVQKLDFQTINNLFQKIGQKSPSQANQCRALLSHFLNWCEELNYRENNTNPCRDIKIFKLGQKTK